MRRKDKEWSDVSIIIEVVGWGCDYFTVVCLQMEQKCNAMN